MHWFNPTPLLAAGIEGLIIFLVFIAISALSNWLKRKRGEAETPLFDEDESPPALPRRREPPLPRQRPAPPPAQMSWEEEIRRLLEGDQPTAPAPAPPPVARETRPLPVPPLVQTPPEPEVDLESAPIPTLRRAPTPVIEAPRVELPTLSESASAYIKASQLSERVAQRFENVDQRTATAVPDQPVIRTRGLAPDAAAFVRQLRSGRSARQAILATVILGPPKALEG
jgi:hypothetical protein